jgi:CubicO group peptidase (beta-lactamase class C family)
VINRRRESFDPGRHAAGKIWWYGERGRLGNLVLAMNPDHAAGITTCESASAGISKFERRVTSITVSSASNEGQLAMTANRRSERLSAEVLSVLRESVQDRIFPGAVAALISSTDEIYIPFGRETYDPTARPISDESIFDVASLTKILATATAIMQLVERKQLALHDRAFNFVPQLRQVPKDKITIFQLLAHMAGFPGGEPLSRHLKSRDEILESICSINLLYLPGTGRIYDDLGYILLGVIVESLTGLTLDKYCQNEIFEPLAMSETMFVPPKALLRRVVPTEIDDDRGGLLRGIVHDERAYLMGGVAGHAGIFTTARDLGKFARSMMDHDQGLARTLSAASIRLMWSRHWQDSEGEYGLGWDRLRPSYMNGIDDDDAVGHTGFTGVSLVISPKRDLALILLSNRVHPVRCSTSLIGQARRRFVEAVMRYC